MPQSLVKNYIHIVFSTKYRNDFIDENIENELVEILEKHKMDYDEKFLRD